MCSKCYNTLCLRPHQSFVLHLGWYALILNSILHPCRVTHSWTCDLMQLCHDLDLKTVIPRTRPLRIERAIMNDVHRSNTVDQTKQPAYEELSEDDIRIYMVTMLGFRIDFYIWQPSTDCIKDDCFETPFFGSIDTVLGGSDTLQYQCNHLLVNVWLKQPWTSRRSFVFSSH